MLNRVAVVEHMLSQGVNVNEPVDPSGRTVLDVYMQAHLQSLETAMNMTGSAEQKSAIFLDLEKQSFDMIELLKDYGAVTGSFARGKVHYIK
jgi:hypothetical protein